MADGRLGDQLAEERSVAIRTLLRTPVLDAGDVPDAFRLVARHGPALVEWFEVACGWRLTIDTAAGFARLAKRPAGAVDTSRPLRRDRGSQAPFDRRRYQLLCLIAAELVRHPVTTVGLLAGAVGPEAGLDSSRKGERAAFVDALVALVGWGAVRASAGDVDDYRERDDGNAILTADTARLHHLLVSPTAPSRVPDGADPDVAVDALLREPRYGTAPTDYDEADEAQRLRWARHQLARRLLDDPVVHLDDLSEPERAYLASISGRRWLRDRVTEAGFELEERAEGLMAVDPDGLATDRRFPAPHGNVHQCALLLADRLVSTATTGERVLGRLNRGDVTDEVERILAQVPGWARAYREPGGAERLGREAVDLLASFGLVRTDADGATTARPALARYTVAEPTVADATDHAPASLFDPAGLDAGRFEPQP